jgi:glycosyltransferase involved in cell wall biosynthesis
MALRVQASKNESFATGLSSEGPPAERRLRVFVFLGHGFGARQWTERWSNGEIPGLNERLPYGYYHAADKDCIVEYSEDADENRLTELARRGMRRLLGCDLVHAWRNRKALFAADVVWTHTELEHLAVLALWQFRRRQRRPRLIAQSVWLFDRWNRFSVARRRLYRHLLRQADVLTVLSSENLRAARELFPQIRSEFIRSGTSSDAMVAPVQRAAHRPIRLVALGNDMHRDWKTLIAATRPWSGCRLRIGSKNIDRRLTDYVHNIEVVAPRSDRDVSELYAWADLAVVPLKPNLHASGITVIFEAVRQGLPVVCSDTGGIRGYFSEEDVRYVPPQDPAALRCAIQELAEDDRTRFAMIANAQARVLSADLSTRSYARRHYEISRELVNDAACKSAQSAHLTRIA